MARVELKRIGIPYEMLLDSVEEVGGMIEVGGFYPINNEIKHRLKEIHENRAD